MADKDTPKRDKIKQRWDSLKSERSSWDSHWREISDNVLPRSGRFFADDRNKGGRRHNNIYDSTGTRALRVLAAGMMSGMTSPARPWFRLATADQELMKYAPVKMWLNDVTNLMHSVFQRSNTYRALHSMYEELGAFGTAASIVIPDFDNIIHHYPLTTGEYCIATDYKGDVTTLYREFQKTVHEVVGEFGIDKVSPAVKNMYDQGNLDQWITIIHAIEPRTDRDPGKKDNLNMAWKSIYFEVGADPEKYLRESGFKRFPALCPRWSTAGGDIYGNSPGMEALGDIKQLQHEQLRKAQGIDFKTKPPLQAPTSMKNRDVEMLPGGISFVDMAGPNAGIKTAFEVNIDLNHLLMDIQDVRDRIKGSFYADLFLMLANQTDARMTATEVAERHEEKLLMLGPVLERLQNELLDPLIEMTFDQIMDAGIVPPPPEELRGHEINVELVSMLAQAQRAVGTNSIDRFVGNLGAVAQFKPEVLDNFDADKWASIYSDSLGLDPNIMVPADKVEAIRAQRAKAQQAMQQEQSMQMRADTAAKLASADTSSKNGLTDVTQAFSGYTT
ncbi:MAG: phage head-tail adapter protein [Gammaproteobacteria bacterium]|nr:phage head-tail adapter protein [Gammaproteobacteria bacterium]MBU1732274.1 phage head-tail adapter protein [Gammaproteobacteria bacterium]MBU1893844.1 phage head-tail adapter protein [Gammaproteobacteria bacterium]